MNRKPIVYCCVAIFAAGAVAWFNHTPSPTIRFVGLQDRRGGRVAVFRTANKTDSPFSYYGYGQSAPWHNERVKTAKGWEVSGGGYCGTGADYHTLWPHTSMQFEVNYFNDEERAGPFAVGIDFEQGTPAQVRLRGGRHMPVFFYWLRNRFFPNLEEPKWEPTWSDTVPTDKLGGGN